MRIKSLESSTAVLEGGSKSALASLARELLTSILMQLEFWQILTCREVRSVFVLVLNFDLTRRI